MDFSGIVTAQTSRLSVARFLVVILELQLLVVRHACLNLATTPDPTNWVTGQEEPDGIEIRSMP